jgi:hypothetical protein
MTENDKYSLLFKGLKDDKPTTLRNVKAVFVTDLELPIPTIQEILENPPRCIVKSDQKKRLQESLIALKNAGALVELVDESDNETNTTPEIQESDDDGFSFEIDLSLLTKEKKQSKTKVWELSIDHDEETPALNKVLKTDVQSFNKIEQPISTDPELTESELESNEITVNEDDVDYTLSDDASPKSLDTHTVTEIKEPIESTANESTLAKEDNNKLDLILSAFEDEDEQDSTTIDTVTNSSIDKTYASKDDEIAPSEEDLDILLMEPDEIEDQHSSDQSIDDIFDDKTSNLNFTEDITSLITQIATSNDKESSPDDLEIIDPEEKGTNAAQEKEPQDNLEQAKDQNRKTGKLNVNFVTTNTNSVENNFRLADYNDPNLQPIHTESTDPDYNNGDTTAKKNKLNRRSRVVDWLIASCISAFLFLGINWTINNYLITEESKQELVKKIKDSDIEPIITVADDQNKLQEDSPYAEITEKKIREIILQHNDPSISLKAICGASSIGLVECKISGYGPESELPSKRDRARGVKQPPWLNKLESDKIKFKLVKSNHSRIAEGTANAYITYAGTINRRTVNITMRASPPPPKDSLVVIPSKLKVKISYNVDNTKSAKGLKITRTDNEDFTLLAGESFEF